MGEISESELSKKLQFVINSSSGDRTRLYKTGDRGLLEPANDLDIVESLLIQAVHSAFKDKNVVLLKSCLKPNLSSPRKGKKNVRLLLPPDSRDNLDDESASEVQVSSKRVRFLLPTQSVQNLEDIPLGNSAEEDTDSFDDISVDDTLQEVDVSWDDVYVVREKDRDSVRYSEEKEQTNVKGNFIAKTENVQNKGDENFIESDHEQYSDDFESIGTDTEREFDKEECNLENLIIGMPTVPTEDPAQAPEPVRIFSQIANDKMEDHGIPEAALHRLQMQNTMHNITKAAKIKVHKPKNCHECRDKLAEATERSFLQQKVAVVSEKLLKDKILMQGNEIQEFAAGLKEFPSHKDNPEVIYNRLMRTGQQKSSVAVQTVETRAPEEAVRRLKDYTKSELKLENMDLAKGPPRQFWDKYFEPLNNCAWYPKSPGK